LRTNQNFSGYVRGATTFSIMTLSITTFSIMALSINDIHHK
jgi:hypothetical protein